MVIQPILAPLVTSLDEFKQHPLEVMQTCGDAAVAVLQHNRPVFYAVMPDTWALLQKSGAVQTQAISGASRYNRFEALAAQLLVAEEQRVARGDLSTASVGIIRNRLDAHVLPFFRFVQPSQTTTDVLEKFVQRLQVARLSNTTISQYLVIVRKLLKLGIRHGVLKQLPEWPMVRVVTRPRAMLTLREYAQLVRVAHRLSRQHAEAPQVKEGIGEREKFWVRPKHRSLPRDMAWVMRFMVNCFLRPGDVRQLKHKHVEVCRGNGNLYLRLSLPETKRHDAVVVSMRAAVHVYETARAHAQAQGRAGPEDYVFLPEEKDRDYALAVLGFWFKWVMRESDLFTHDQWGRARTLYCLRHTAIMFRLLYGQGIDILTLARNARTSVQMIERFYASALDGEMNVAMLQSRRVQV